MLHVGASVFCKFNGSFNTEYVVRPPSKRAAAIPDDAITSAVLFCDRMVAKISERRKVLPVPPGASMKNNPPLYSVIARIILSYAMRCSRINCGRFVLTNVPSSSESQCVSRCKSRSKMLFAGRFEAGIPSCTSALLAIVSNICLQSKSMLHYTRLV
ncbi:transposon Tf2-6 polyprotein [Trichonephila clavipes]|nr:transposon Tf2-6 polyprotein [Trichonephila clavipes]